MGRTPDAYDGPRIDEAIIWEEQTSDPSENFRQQYVQDKGLVIFEDGVLRGLGESRVNIWQFSVDDRAVDTPPGSPTTGYRVIVGSSPTGDFIGHAGKIAQWNGFAWVFTTPKQGTVTFVKDESALYKQTASSAPWVWSKVFPGGYFGTELQYAESNSQSSTTATTFQLKVRLTTTSLPVGTYIVFWSSIISGSLASTVVEAQLEQDDTIGLSSVRITPGPAYSTVFSGHVIRESFSGVHTFDIEWRREAGGGQAYIEQVRITLWRIV